MIRWLFRAIFGPNKTEKTQGDWRRNAYESLTPKASYYRAGLTRMDRREYSEAAREVGRRNAVARVESRQDYEHRTEVRNSAVEREQRQSRAEGIYDKFIAVEKSREAEKKELERQWRAANDNGRER